MSKIVTFYYTKLKPYLGYLKWKQRIRFEFFQQRPSTILDKRVIEALNTGIEVYKDEYYHFKILFNNGLYMEGWNANKYYSWGGSGKFLHNDYRYEWKDSRLSTTVMAKLLYQIELYEKSH